jgi:hypothetical protein
MLHESKALNMGIAGIKPRHMPTPTHDEVPRGLLQTILDTSGRGH